MKTALRRSSLACLTAASFASSTVLGQVPDAGSLRQEIERQREVQLPRKLAPTVPAEPPALKALTGQTITLTSFRFAGHTLLGVEQLAAAVAPYLHRPIDFNQLQDAATAVANTYREAGWTVRAYLPQQDITDGIVTIQIVEAVFGGVQLEGAPATRISLAQIQRGFDAQQKAGAPLNADALDRALLLADDLPGVAVSGSLREGTQAGQTELVIKLADEPLIAGEATLDNTGSRSTGSSRLSASLNLGSPLGIGELISSNLVHTEGSDYLRLGGTLPLGDKGWRVGVNVSNMAYRLVTAEFAALDSKGTSGSAGLEASFPIIRSRLQNLYFSANADFKSFDNEANGTTTTHYKSSSVALGLNGNLFDKLGGGGANSASLQLIGGQLDLSDSPNQAADAASTKVDGGYRKLRYSASRQQVITDEISLYAALSGQWASKNLDSSEKFYLGGAAGVRAYPGSEGGGALGQLINIELRWRLPAGFNLMAFFDTGSVTVNANNEFTGAPVLNDYRLKGGGLSLAWQGSAGLNLKATWARRIGDNPNPGSTGNDQDGSLVSNRFWLAAALPF